MQVQPTDTLSTSEKRAVLNKIRELQERYRYSLVDACAEVKRSLPDVQRWKKELAEHDSREAIARGIALYDAGRPLSYAANHACVLLKDLQKALKARGRAKQPITHIAYHSRGSTTLAY